MNKKLGEEEVVLKNYDYLLLAQKYGFFQDGYIEDDIATCSDWIIVWWIDELGKKKEDKDKFVSEILPTFRRWFSNGLKSTRVGCYYDILKKAEVYGIKVDNNSFQCLNRLFLPNEYSLDVNFNNYSKISNYFYGVGIINDLKEFHEKGFPINNNLGDSYDLLMKLNDLGENVNFDTLTFFSTCGMIPDEDKMELFNRKKFIEREYHYSSCNADEVKKLYNWVGYYGGYNKLYVEELENKIKNYQQKVEKYCIEKVSSNQLSRRLKEVITIYYYEYNNNGESNMRSVTGRLVSFDNNKIVISQNSDTGETSMFEINDEYPTFIQKIVCNKNTLLYQSKTIYEREKIVKLQNKIKEIKSDNIVEKYVAKFNTLAGLAYLKKYASLFIENVDSLKYPIDNLFAYCFENLACLLVSSYSIEDILKKCLLIHNGIIAGKYKVYHNNYDYPLDTFLSSDNLDSIRNTCYIVATLPFDSHTSDNNKTFKKQ